LEECGRLPDTSWGTGAFLGGQVYYYNTPSMPTGKHWFDVSNITELPQVTILYGHRA
jgi:L-asparaginase/Glu-tRNA(Gln) amidotransferase subunit D